MESTSALMVAQEYMELTTWCDSIPYTRYSAGDADVQRRRDIYAIIGNQTVKDGSGIYPLNFIDRSQRFSGLHSRKKKKMYSSFGFVISVPEVGRFGK